MKPMKKSLQQLAGEVEAAEKALVLAFRAFVIADRLYTEAHTLADIETCPECERDWSACRCKPANPVPVSPGERLNLDEEC